MTMQKISDTIGSFATEKIRDHFLKKLDSFSRRKQLSEAFARGVNRCVMAQTSNDEYSFVFAFVDDDYVYENIEKTLDLSTRSEALIALTQSFEGYSKGAFSNAFSYKECINQGISEVERQMTLEFRNILSIARTIGDIRPMGEIRSIENKNTSYTFNARTPQLNKEYFDYNNALNRLEQAFITSNHVAISGVYGSGKKTLAIQYANIHSPCILVDCTYIITLDALLAAIEKKAVAIPQNHTASDLLCYFSQHMEWTIILINLGIQATQETLEYIERLPCAVLITTTEERLGNLHIVEHPLPTIDAAANLYRFFLDSNECNDESISQIVSFIGCTPRMLYFTAQLQNTLHCSSSELLEKLTNEKCSFTKTPIYSGIKILGVEQNVLTYLGNILQKSLDMTQAEKKIIGLFTFFGDQSLSRRFVNSFQLFVGISITTINNLVKKGYVDKAENDNYEEYSINPLLQYILESDDEEDAQREYVSYILEYIIQFTNTDYPCHEKELREACDIAENLFNNLYNAEPAVEITFLLLKKCHLLCYLSDYQSSIKEYHRILTIPGIEESPRYAKVIKINLAEVLALYELPDEAISTLSELKREDLTKHEIEKVHDIEMLIAALQHNYGVVIEATLTAIDPRDEVRVGQYQLLATMYYYMGNIEEAITYNKEAIALLEKLQWTNTGIASNIYTAYSAALLDNGQILDAIKYGFKGLHIAIDVYGNNSKHTLVSRNNLANALYANRQFPEAYAEYSKVVDSHSNILSPMAKVIINSKTSQFLCKLLMGQSIDASQLRRFLVGIAEVPECYAHVMNLFLTACKMACDDYRLDILNILLGIMRIWVYEFIEYPSQDHHKKVLRRFEIILMIGQRLYKVNYLNKVQTNAASRNFDRLSGLIIEGYFDNADDPISYTDDDRSVYLPVYSSKLLAPINRKVGEPVFYVNKYYNIPDDATFGVRITDDSMSPSIEVYDILWVREQDNVPENCIGVYSSEDKSKWLCRKVSKISDAILLCPSNRKYPAIRLSEHIEWKLQGIALNVNEV